MVKFTYNSGWVTWRVGPQTENIVFEIQRRLSSSLLGTRVMTWLEPRMVFHDATILTYFP
jgi:hypothetical protein